MDIGAITQSITLNELAEMRLGFKTGLAITHRLNRDVSCGGVVSRFWVIPFYQQGEPEVEGRH
jgi:hypothetical protein